MDRVMLSRCIAKIVAYYACGKHEAAREWVQTLLDIFRKHGLLD